ncbi:hypothetical protein TELCIR_17731, partial [Teladorsagia circumcincta]
MTGIFSTVRETNVVTSSSMAALSETISSWDAKDPSKRGLPSEELVNIYDKWGHGKFGMIITGNICVDP